MAHLPDLQLAPSFHPDCCLSLSHHIIATILEALQDGRGIILSIGAGSGLLEALLLQAMPDLPIEGIEVSHGMNKYLPEQHFDVVQGTAALYARASLASTLVFVYPRQTDLVHRYIQQYKHNSVLRRIIWIGPILDWEDFKSCFDIPQLTIAQTTSLSQFELMVVLEKTSTREG